MKKYRNLASLCIAMMALPWMAASAAAPSVNSFSATSAMIGQGTVLTATVSDPDSDLDYVAFYVSGPGETAWVHIGNLDVSGTSGTAKLNWVAGQTGAYAARAVVYDLTASAARDATFDVFVGQLVVPAVRLRDGENRIYEYPGEVVTTENTSAGSVVVESGGNLVLWSGGRIVLKPGFRAEHGASFWAAIDHNMNGYSDLEEATDTDGDGMFDAWEMDHGLNPIANDAGGDLDGDGTSNLAEFIAGRDPRNRADGGVSVSASLVLRTPSGNLGINTATWEIHNL